MSFDIIYYIFVVMRQVSVKEYGEIVGKSRQWILYCITNDIELPGAENIKDIQRIGKAYVITLKQKKSK